MTTFTDEDLKMLKEAERPVQLDSTAEGGVGWYTLFNPDKLEALIARLEAAEAIARSLDGNHPDDANCGCVTCRELKTWREASGK